MKALFLATRPYSYGFNLALAWFAVSVADTGASPATYLRAGVASLAAWAFFNWTSDKVQHDPGKPKAHIVLQLVALALAAVAAWSPAGCALLAAYVIAIFVYSFKARFAVVGPVGPLLRGLTVLAAISWLASVPSGVANLALLENAPVFLAVALVVQRNLVGDIRDSDQDTHEIPARFGAQASIVAVVLLATVVCLIALSTQNLTIILVIVPIEIAVASIVALSKASPIISRRLHRGLIVTDTSVVCWQTLILGASLVWTAAAVALALILAPTYSRTPGKKY